MKIERIVLNNFRQYYGQQLIRISDDRERNVTLFHGVNGAGKTSLFLAINWCLYGKSIEGVKIIENVGDLVSKEAMRRTAPGELVKTAVEVRFSHNGDRYVVQRTLLAGKRLDGILHVDDLEEFTMFRIRHDGQSERINNPMYTINSILPPNVREYFLFDGEKIDSFAKAESAKQVKDAIYLVLRLEVLDRARRHLQTAAEDYRKELRQTATGELRELSARDEKTREDLKKAQLERDRLTNEIHSAQKKIAEIEQNLRELDNAKPLQVQRDRLTRDLQQLEVARDSTISKIRDLVANSASILASDAIAQALTILDQKRSRGEIPSNIRQRFVQDLLDQMQCICGRPVAEGSIEHQRLVALMAHSLPGALEEDVLQTHHALGFLRQNAPQRLANLTELMRQRTTITADIKRLDDEMTDIRHKLEGMPLEEISGLERQRQQFSEDRDSNNVRLGSIEERIKRLSDESKQLETAIERAQKSRRQEEFLSLKMNLAQRAADAIDEMYEQHADDMRKQIQTKTKEIFRQLAWKEEQFTDVRLGPDYNLEVIDRYGLPARSELSAGERQVLSLSFIAAMSRMSEEEAPLIMDTPFGRLSSQHRDTITQRLPDLTNQWVLFVTDEELRDQAFQNLAPRIGAEYHLEFNDATGCTTVVEERR